MISTRRGKRCGIHYLTLAAAAAFLLPQPVHADGPATTQDTLLDRILIEDLMVAYYTLLTAEDRHDIGSYFTADAVLEANKRVLEGRDAIQSLYDSARDPRILPGNVHNLLLGNPRISVDGNRATMDAIWTGVVSDSATATPRVLEQGTEHTEFVKENGRWLISKRTIVTQGGLPQGWAPQD